MLQTVTSMTVFLERDCDPSVDQEYGGRDTVWTLRWRNSSNASRRIEETDYSSFSSVTPLISETPMMRYLIRDDLCLEQIMLAHVVQQASIIEYDERFA